MKLRLEFFCTCLSTYELKNAKKILIEIFGIFQRLLTQNPTDQD